jgi:hypothetical protein
MAKPSQTKLFAEGIFLRIENPAESTGAAVKKRGG